MVERQKICWIYTINIKLGHSLFEIDGWDQIWYLAKKIEISMHRCTVIMEHQFQIPHHNGRLCTIYVRMYIQQHNLCSDLLWNVCCFSQVATVTELTALKQTIDNKTKAIKHSMKKQLPKRDLATRFFGEHLVNGSH